MQTAQLRRTLPSTGRVSETTSSASTDAAASNTTLSLAQIKKRHQGKEGERQGKANQTKKEGEQETTLLYPSFSLFLAFYLILSARFHWPSRSPI